MFAEKEQPRLLVYLNKVMQDYVGTIQSIGKEKEVVVDREVERTAQETAELILNLERVQADGRYEKIAQFIEEGVTNWFSREHGRQYSVHDISPSSASRTVNILDRLIADGWEFASAARGQFGYQGKQQGIFEVNALKATGGRATITPEMMLREIALDAVQILKVMNDAYIANLSWVEDPNNKPIFVYRLPSDEYITIKPKYLKGDIGPLHTVRLRDGSFTWLNDRALADLNAQISQPKEPQPENKSFIGRLRREKKGAGGA